MKKFQRHGAGREARAVSRRLKVAVANYHADAPVDFAAFADKQVRLLAEASAAGAGLAVLPEYLAFELATTFGDHVRASPAATLQAIQRFHPAWLALFGLVARELRLHVVAGSFPLAVRPGRYRNRCHVFAPDGSHGWQDKLRLDGFEARLDLIEPGDALKVMETGAIHSAVAIGYDAEFPLSVRAQCDAGAQLLLVPGRVDDASGVTRRRVGCQARALENRCFVASAGWAGGMPWPGVGTGTAAIECTGGGAGIYAPSVAGLPSDGVIVTANAGECWAMADIDVGTLTNGGQSMEAGHVRDWRRQHFPSVAREKLQAFASAQ